MDIFPAVWAGCCVVVGFSSVVVLFVALLEVLKPPTNVFLTIAFLSCYCLLSFSLFFKFGMIAVFDCGTALQLIWVEVLAAYV